MDHGHVNASAPLMQPSLRGAEGSRQRHTNKAITLKRKASCTPCDPYVFGLSSLRLHTLSGGGT